MREIGRFCLTSALVVVAMGGSGGAAQDLVAAARAALGGDRALASVRSFRLKGQKLLRNQSLDGGKLAGEAFVSSPVEIKAQFPDRYLQSVDLAIGSMNRRFESGFAGPQLLNKTVGAQGLLASSPDALLTQKREFARLVLLVLLRTDTALALVSRKTPGSAGAAWTTPDGDEILLSFDATSALPVRATYQVAMRGRDGNPSGVRTEHVLEIRNRQVVDGIKIPSRLVLMRDGLIVEDMRFDSIEINPTFPAQTFAGGPESTSGRH